MANANKKLTSRLLNVVSKEVIKGLFSSLLPETDNRKHKCVEICNFIHLDMFRLLEVKKKKFCSRTIHNSIVKCLFFLPKKCHINYNLWRRRNI